MAQRALRTQSMDDQAPEEMPEADFGNSLRAPSVFLAHAPQTLGTNLAKKTEPRSSIMSYLTHLNQFKGNIFCPSPIAFSFMVLV
jgi:hypothetical protein